jgi:Fur family transcriptional regulator, ferric uptake regulator
MQQENLKKFLEEKGWRLTKQRNAIIQNAVSCKGHFDPESLYMEMRQKGVKASRASVYRTLNLLYECGLVEKVRKTEHGTIYEHSLGRQHHDHMVCIACGEIIEFYSERLEKLQEEICQERDFIGANHTLEIRGYCRHCHTKITVREGDSSHG